MIEMVKEVINCLFVSYFLGCANAAYYYSSLVYGVDIRNYGSGNAGTTNILRTFGLKAALIVFSFDFIKAYIAMSVSMKLAEYGFTIILAGIAIIVGHCFPIFLKFRGGKGIASSIGLFIALCPLQAGIAIGAGAVLLLLTGYVSLASVAGMVLFPIVLILYKVELYKIILAIIISSIAVYQHRENIKRLLNGSESNIYKKNKNKEK